MQIAGVVDPESDRYWPLLVPVHPACHGRQMATNDVTKTDVRLAARCAALASLGAAFIHIAVAPMHWQDWPASGMFFAAIAVVQVVWAFFAWTRPAPALLAAGAAMNAGSIALWVMSRTAGAPFGPHAGQPEAVDAAGICALLLQCYVVMGAGWAWSRRDEAEQVSGFGRAVVLIAANTVMATAVTAGLASSLQGHQHHHDDVADAQGGSRVEPVAPKSPEAGLPVTDMSLHSAGESAADGHRHHE